MVSERGSEWHLSIDKRRHDLVEEVVHVISAYPFAGEEIAIEDSKVSTGLEIQNLVYDVDARIIGPNVFLPVTTILVAAIPDVKIVEHCDTKCTL